MRQYNVEIFDENINFVSNTIVSDYEYKFDYLDPAINKITVSRDIEVRLNYYVRIWTEEESIIGIVSQIKESSNGEFAVTIKDVRTMLDVRTMVDVESFGGTLENFIKSQITALYISNPDTAMNISASVVVQSETAYWELNIVPEDEELTTLAQINLMDDVVIPAFKQYGIIIETNINLAQRTIEFKILKNTRNPLTIEADLPSIISKTIVVQEAKKQINKVIVNNDDTWQQSVTYYLHPDGTFDTNNSDRIRPVAWQYATARETKIVDHDTQEETIIPFSENALKKAAGIFAKNRYDNLIQLKVLSDDELVKARTMKIGQVVNVITEGMVYTSILTGKQVKDTTTLVFGMIRTELTTIMKGRG